MGVIPWEQFGTFDIAYFGLSPWGREVFDYVCWIETPEALVVGR